MMYQKLSDNLSTAARGLEDLIQRYVARQEESIQPSVEPPIERNPSDEIEEEEKWRTSESSRPMMEPIEMEEGLQNAQREDLQRIGRNMQSLHRIYTDLAGHVMLQQDTIDTIESHMGSAA